MRMKSLNTIKKLIENERENLKQQYQVETLGIFGSYATGKPRKDSDIDILVEFSKTPDFFKFLRLERALEQLLGLKVDLVTRKALKPAIKKTVLDQTVFV